MTKEKEKKDCFIIMPITTPKEMVEVYSGDRDHFKHVLESLFIPAIEKADFNPIPPKSKGSDIIQAEIIKHLAEADLVLCDMSILNPNVFYEFGIRTALDKPVALVKDDKTHKVPFDTGMINYHEYNSCPTWALEKEIDKLVEHINNASKKAAGKNSLWKYFGIAQTGSFRPGEATTEDKLNLILTKIVTLEDRIEGVDDGTFTSSISPISKRRKSILRKSILERLESGESLVLDWSDIKSITE